LAAWLFYSLYQQLKAQPDLDKVLALMKTIPFGASAWKFWAVLAMVFVNWGLEARKWQMLISTIQPMGFFKAYRSVLCGVTMSLNIPNRMGEYAGRVLFVSKGNRGISVTLSIAGSMAQLIITMLMGTCGLAILYFAGTQTALPEGASFFWLSIILYGSILATILLLLFFFRLGAMTKLLEKLPGARRFIRYILVLKTFDAKILLRLLGLSLVRYLVFVLQYIFMLQLLQVEQNYWQSFWLVSVQFLILAVIPSIAIAELGIRGTVAKTLFAYSSNLMGILAVTFGVWFINLFIPAFIGSLLILGIKIKKDK
jgi:hypothetical protein